MVTGSTGHSGRSTGAGPAPGTPVFRHDAPLYSSTDELTGLAAPFLLDGLAAGDAAVVAVGPEATAPLHEAVGDDPRVLVVEREALYRPRTPSAISSFRRLAAEHAASGRCVRVVGEVDFGATAADSAEWQRYESVINDAFATLPLWGLCVFDATRLPEPVLATARQAHPHLRTAAGRRANPYYVDPAELLTALPVPDEPLEGTAPALAADDVTDFIGLRHAVRDRLAHVDGPADLVDDFLLAVDEMASNRILPTPVSRS